MNIDKNLKKLIGFLIISYFSMAIILFPSWYYHVLQDGGFGRLFYESQRNYFPIVIISTIGLALIVYALHNKVKQEGDFLNKFLNSNSYSLTLILLFAIAGFRLILSGVYSQRIDYGIIAQITNNEKQSEVKNLKTPVDFVYINNSKVGYLFDQTKEKMKLEEMSIKKTNKSDLGIETGSENIAKVKGNIGTEKEETSSYKASTISIANKNIDVINYLYAQNRIKDISSIEFQSEELMGFDKAISIITKYNLSFSSDKINGIRNKIITENLKTNVPTEFVENEWMFISGLFEINEGEKYLDLKFNYAPNYPDRVQFCSSVSKKDIDASELKLLQTENSWNLNLFGKIIHRKESNGNIIYTFQCYSIMR